MIISQSGIVDIIPEYNRQLRPIFCVSEGDKNTRMINITVQQAGENFSIPSGASVYVTGKKQDNTIFTYSCTYSGYIVSFQIAEQMSAANGIVLCELQIVDGGNPLGSANFVYWVEPSPVQDGTASESDLNVFLEAILGAEKLDRFYADVEDMVTEAVSNIQIHEGQTVIDASLSVSGAAADAKATGDIVRAFMNALITETTETATIATCDDAAGGLPLKRLVANIVPAQAGSGDPSPDNVRAISGYTGVTVTRTGQNIIDENAFTGSAWTNNGDGTFTLRKNGSGLTNRNGTVGFTVRPGETLTFSADIVASSLTTGIDLNLGYVNDVNMIVPISNGHCTATMTAANGSSQVRLYLSSGASGVDTDYVTLKNIHFEYGNIETEYTPYNGATYTATFPSEAGTVYGGTLTVYDDGSGALTVNKGYWSDDGTANWTRNTDGSFYVLKGGAAAQQSDVTGCACNYAPYRATFDGVNTFVRSNGLVYLARGWGNLYADVASLKAAFSATPLQVVYPLATPTTYALSAVQVAQMLQGDNNIWMDAAGTLTTEYYASTGLYVEKKVNAQRNMIAGVEEAMIATKNYAVGDLLIVGNTLYKVTAAISSGAALVVRTNVTETTVAEQLLALA